MSSASDILIRVSGLRKKLQKKEVLRGVDLEIPKGSIVVILGRSGCGKSVLLKHVAGLFKPDAGSLLVGDKDIAGMDTLDFLRHGIKISMLFQNSALFDSLTIRENVGFYLDRYASMTDAEKDAKVAEKLSLVDLKNVEGLKPFQLSGGMQKRAALARALMMEPDIMLYDEPTTGLDPITADAINSMILDLNRKFGMTSLVVTHDLTSAFRIGDRLAMLHEGVIVFEGTVDGIKESAHPHVRRFLAGGDHFDEAAFSGAAHKG